MEDAALPMRYPQAILPSRNSSVCYLTGSKQPDKFQVDYVSFDRKLSVPLTSEFAYLSRQLNDISPSPQRCIPLRERGRPEVVVDSYSTLRRTQCSFETRPAVDDTWRDK